MTADAVGGVWTYALDLAGGLAACGVEVVLAVLGPPPSAAQEASAEAVPGLRLVATELPLDWTAADPADLVGAAKAIAGLAREIDADLVHLNTPALAGAAEFSCPVIVVCHSCLSTWWRAVRGGPLPDDFRWRTELVRRGLERAAAVVAPSAAFAAATAAAYDLPRLPIVVHNGRRERPQSRREAAPPGMAAAFTAGRLWDEGKNLAALDRAAARLSVPVLAAGPLCGPNGAAVEPAYVRALGVLPEAGMARLFDARPVFVSAARYEPFGLAVLEAAQAGCALVLSDIPTFRELWDGAAIFASADDDCAIAAAISRLMDSPGARAALGRAAQARASRFTVEAMASGMTDLYAAILVRAADRPETCEAAA